MKGWMGTILRVDLTTGEILKRELDEDIARMFLGGRGLNSYTLFKELKTGIDPLGPENLLLFAPGALTATGTALSSRIEVSTLSPYSKILGDGSAGAHFPTFLKRAGYDQLIITGQAETPKYILIEDDKVEILDASGLWGKSIWEATDKLEEIHGKGINVAGIGQAGENLVRFATTMFDKHASAARGSGAVMGSKNLKAIVVKGTRKPEIASKEDFKQLSKEDKDFFLKDKFHKEQVGVYGTHLGMLNWGPAKNNFEKRLTSEECPEQLRPEKWKEFETRRYFCFGCPIGCKNMYKIPEGKYKDEVNAGLEYEIIDCLGTNCGIEDPIAIMVMENLCDKYGMCVIAIGNTVALAKNLYEKGILTEKETGGHSLDWGDIEAQVELVHQTAFREGFGNMIAEGLYNLAKLSGKNAMDYSYHVKGLSRGPRPAGLEGLAHATSTRGSDHLRGRTWAHGQHDSEIMANLIAKKMLPEADKDPAGALIVGENVTTISDAIGRCKCGVTNWAAAVPLVWKYPLLEGVAKLLSSVTGIEFSEEDVVNAAERIYAIERAFNIKQGITRNDDRLAQRAEIINTSEGEEELKEHERLLTEYYRLRGYDEKTGVPTRAKLESLGLQFVADELEKDSPYPSWNGPPLKPLGEYPHGGERS